MGSRKLHTSKRTGLGPPQDFVNVFFVSKEEMVHSQMVALEEPDPEIETDVIKIDVTNEKEEVQREALERTTAKIKEYDAVVQNGKDDSATQTNS